MDHNGVFNYSLLNIMFGYRVKLIGHAIDVLTLNLRNISILSRSVGFFGESKVLLNNVSEFGDEFVARNSRVCLCFALLSEHSECIVDNKMTG